MSDEHLVAERLLGERAERRRIAEQLHDGPVQHVAALSQMLDAALAALEGDDVASGRRVVARALEVARDAAEELRGIVAGLEPVMLDEVGLAAAVRELADRTAGRRGARVELDDRRRGARRGRSLEPLPGDPRGARPGRPPRPAERGLGVGRQDTGGRCGARRLGRRRAGAPSGRDRRAGRAGGGAERELRGGARRALDDDQAAAFRRARRGCDSGPEALRQSARSGRCAPRRTRRRAGRRPPHPPGRRS